MFEAGEDPLFIARRFVRIAGEDIGLADPTALNFAVSTMQGNFQSLAGRGRSSALLLHGVASHSVKRYGATK